MESLKKSQTKCEMTLTYLIAKKIIVIHLLLFTIILLCCFVTNDKISFRYDVTLRDASWLSKKFQKKIIAVIKLPATYPSQKYITCRYTIHINE